MSETVKILAWLLLGICLASCGPAHVPEVPHGPGYLPAYQPIEPWCSDESSLACFKYRLLKVSVSIWVAA